MSILKTTTLITVTMMLAAPAVMAQTHGGSANGGVGISENGGSGATATDSNQVASTSEAPANSGSRASNSTASTTNGKRDYVDSVHNRQIAFDNERDYQDRNYRENYRSNQ